MENREVFLPIIGYEDSYEVSNFGRIYSHKRGGRFLKLTLDSYGYAIVSLYKNDVPIRHKVHRLVGTHFVQGYVEGLVINHINFIRNDNHHTNLEWVTYKENHVHSQERIAHGRANNYLITFPDGSQEKIRNLASFCRKHALDKSNMVKTSKLPGKTHKNFTCRRL